MSGLDAVSTLRRRGRKDLVVGVTGNALLSDQQDYLDMGVDRVLTKPVLERSLKGMLAMAADRRKGVHARIDQVDAAGHAPHDSQAQAELQPPPKKSTSPNVQGAVRKDSHSDKNSRRLNGISERDKPLSGAPHS